jgi:hypothetical protein
MSISKQLGILLGALTLIGAVVYLAHRREPPAALQPEGLATGLAWIPPRAGLVLAIDVAAFRQQAWLVDAVSRISPEAQAGPDYLAFVAATGFDYRRDLDQLWMGVFGSENAPHVVGVARGRFAREKILVAARHHHVNQTSQAGIEIYEIRSPLRKDGTAQGFGFAFAFLDGTHLAYGSDAVRVAQLVDCWLGRQPGLESDLARFGPFARTTSAHHAWVMDDLSQWSPSLLRNQTSIASQLRQLAVGLRLSPMNLAIEAEAVCRGTAEAREVRDHLQTLLLVSRFALARQPDESAKALATLVNRLTLTQQNDTIKAQLQVTPELLAALLAPPGHTERR